MAKIYPTIPKRLQKFIEVQKMFFVATAPKNGRINLSPKGMDTFRVLDESRVAWLSVTGSGNETAAHLLENGRITIMFCAFEGAPNILRLYGTAKEIRPNQTEWDDLINLFPELPGARQIFIMEIRNAQTSCGMSIPYYNFISERNQLIDWANNKGKDGIENYWEEKNQRSIDGLSTGILD